MPNDAMIPAHNAPLNVWPASCPNAWARGMPMPENANANAAAMTTSPSAQRAQYRHPCRPIGASLPRIASMGRTFAARIEGTNAPSMHVATPSSSEPSHAVADGANAGGTNEPSPPAKLSAAIALNSGTASRLAGIASSEPSSEPVRLATPTSIHVPARTWLGLAPMRRHCANVPRMRSTVAEPTTVSEKNASNATTT